jgi:hypothetical protein
MDYGFSKHGIESWGSMIWGVFDNRSYYQRFKKDCTTQLRNMNGMHSLMTSVSKKFVQTGNVHFFPFIITANLTSLNSNGKLKRRCVQL